MKRNTSTAYRWRIVSGLFSCFLMLSLSVACSKNPPKSMDQPTSDQVRSHSDKTFDKLKQEERDRATQ
ncbi:hypothetical protein [Petrachloros mirabilis]